MSCYEFLGHMTEAHLCMIKYSCSHLVSATDDDDDVFKSNINLITPKPGLIKK